jgi:Domain of unknown function (DUF1707)
MMRYRWDPVYPTGGRRSAPSTDAALRASDAERNQVADKLSRHFADGRLDQIEFRARLDRAMGATTRGDLEGLFDDLPPLGDEVEPAPRRRRRLAPVAVAIALFVLVASAVGSSFTVMRVPWILLVVVGLLVWHRTGNHHSGHRSRSGSDH